MIIPRMKSLDTENRTLFENYMDRLNQLKFNPFELNNDIALSNNNTHLGHVLNTSVLVVNRY